MNHAVPMICADQGWRQERKSNNSPPYIRPTESLPHSNITGVKKRPHSLFNINHLLCTPKISWIILHRPILKYGQWKLVGVKNKSYVDFEIFVLVYIPSYLFYHLPFWLMFTNFPAKYSAFCAACQIHNYMGIGNFKGGFHKSTEVESPLMVLYTKWSYLKM